MLPFSAVILLRAYRQVGSGIRRDCLSFTGLHVRKQPLQSLPVEYHLLKTLVLRLVSHNEVR